MKRIVQSLVLALLSSGCRTAAQIHPLAIEHNEYCTRYLGEGQLDKAQHRCELALEYNPDYPEPYNNLCLIWIRRGELDRAKEMCIKALRLNNDFAQAHNNLGYIYLQQRSFGKAHDSFNNALRINPGYVEARYNLCLSYLKLKKNPQARICYEKVLEVRPNTADAFNDLCVMDIDEEKNASAVDNCSRAVALSPDYVDGFFHLGRALQASGKHCEAQEAYKRCVALDDSHSECRNNLSSAVRHCALGSPQIQAAREGAAQANSPQAFLELGLEEKGKGLLLEAERHFKRCVKLDGRFGPCYCQLAGIAQKDARLDEAKKACRKCLDYSTDEETGPEREGCQRLLKE